MSIKRPEMLDECTRRFIESLAMPGVQQAPRKQRRKAVKPGPPAGLQTCEPQTLGQGAFCHCRSHALWAPVIAKKQSREGPTTAAREARGPISESLLNRKKPPGDEPSGQGEMTIIGTGQLRGVSRCSGNSMKKPI